MEKTVINKLIQHYEERYQDCIKEKAKSKDDTERQYHHGLQVELETMLYLLKQQIEAEKQQLEDAYDRGYYDGGYGVDSTADIYYNSKFNQQ